MVFTRVGVCSLMLYGFCGPEAVSHLEFLGGLCLFPEVLFCGGHRAQHLHGCLLNTVGPLGLVHQEWSHWLLGCLWSCWVLDREVREKVKQE